MIRIVAIVVVLMLPTALGAEDEPPIVLMGVKIPGLFDTEDAGPYNKVYERLIGGYGLEYSLREAPLRRAINAFVKGDVDCFLFATGDKNIYIGHGMAGDELLISNPINFVALKLYTRAGEAVIHDVADVRGSYVAIDQGATDISRAAEHLSIDPNQLLPAQTLTQAFLLLNQRRVEAVVAFDGDVKTYLKRAADSRTYGVSETLSLGSSQDSVICRRTETTERFMSHVNKKLSELSASGELKQILSAR